MCLIMAMLVLAGCANGGTATSSEWYRRERRGGQRCRKRGGREYAVIMSLNQLEFFDALKAGVNDACTETGAKWYFAGPQEAQPDKTAEAIDQAVAKGVTGIIHTGSLKKPALR